MNGRSLPAATILAFVIAVAAEPMPGAKARGSRGEAGADLADEAMISVSASDLIAIGRVTDRRVEIGTGSFKEMRPVVAVEAVLCGDPDVKSFVLDSRSIELETAKDFILFARGESGAKVVCRAVPDSPANRKAVREAIAAKLRRERDDKLQGFLDVDRSLDEGEKLLRRLLERIARAAPDHPYLGKKAVAGVKICRVKTPPGVYVRVDGGLKETETVAGRRRIPVDENAVSLWIGIGVRPHNGFRIGASAYPWGDHGYGAASTPRDAGQRPLTYFRRESLYDPSQTFPITLELEAPYDPKGPGELSDAVSAAFHEFSAEYRKFAENPPQNVDEALACLGSLPKKARPPDGDLLLPALRRCFEWKGIRLAPYLAFVAIDKEWRAGRLTEAQKRKAIPILLDLLTDRTVVLDQSPADGPVVLSHEMAYDLLRKLSGRDFPPPIRTWMRGGRGAAVLPRPPERDKETPEEIEKKLEVWVKWWRETGQE